MNKKIARISLFLVLGVLFVVTLACKQSGEIVPDAVATQRAMPTVTPTQNLEEVVDAEFEKGDDVVFGGKGFLIPFYANPGDFKVLSHAARNDAGVVLDAVLFEGDIWYKVKSVAGEGWASEESLQAPEE